MSFITDAQEFVKDQGDLSGSKYRDEMKETVQYLLDHAIGVKNAVATSKIIDHLHSKGHMISREAWQIEVLGKLREYGIFIASSRGRSGMFLINNENDATVAYNSIYNRINVQQHRLNILEQLMKDQGWVIKK
jgi:hypothetical protein